MLGFFLSLFFFFAFYRAPVDLTKYSNSYAYIALILFLSQYMWFSDMPHTKSIDYQSAWDTVTFNTKCRCSSKPSVSAWCYHRHKVLNISLIQTSLKDLSSLLVLGFLSLSFGGFVIHEVETVFSSRISLSFICLFYSWKWTLNIVSLQAFHEALH